MSAAAHNTADWLTAHAATAPGRPAIVDGNRRLDYGALEHRVACATGVFASRGIGRGDRIAFLLSNRSAAIETVFACARLGAIAVPMNTRLAAPEIAQQLADCRPRLLLHEADDVVRVEKACTDLATAPDALPVADDGPGYEAALAAASPRSANLDVDADDPMILMYTSGTTGTPKGALLPHRKTHYNALNAERFFGLGPGDRVGVPVPLFHSFGLKILSLPALHAGALVVLNRHFDPAAFWELVQRESLSFFGAVPTMFAALDAALDETPRDLSGLRFAFTAGAAIPVELIHRFEARGLRLKQGFGQTETSILCCLDVDDAIRKAGSVGKPVEHGELRIVRPDAIDGPTDAWTDCEAGETGEIVVRGPITMTGYWERPDATAETIRDGWLRTGDLGSRDAEGFVTLTGRSKDMFISGGENVYPRQVESVYEAHPAIAEIAVAPIPDARWGEIGCGYLVLAPGATLDPDALIAWGRERLATFKVPRRFVALEALPKTVTGKVQKFRLPAPPPSR